MLGRPITYGLVLVSGVIRALVGSQLLARFTPQSVPFGPRFWGASRLTWYPNFGALRAPLGPPFPGRSRPIDPPNRSHLIPVRFQMGL